MTLKLIGVGYARTGTLSTATALNRLGLRCYHMTEVTENPENRHHLDFWCRVADAPEGTQHDWNEVFAGYQAAVDNPACSVWRELVAAYPDAKVLLTLHPGGADTWYESATSTITFTETLWQYRVLERFSPFARKFAFMCRTLVWKRLHRGTIHDREAALAEYDRHVAEVKATIPPERLLVYTVDRGWAPLCRFLDLPVPDAPFPNVNDRAAFRKAVGRTVRRAHMIIALLILVGVGLLTGVALLVW